MGSTLSFGTNKTYNACCTNRNASSPQTLSVTIHKATNLKAMNISGDAPYVVCKVVTKSSFEKASALAQSLVMKAQTEAKSKTLEPEWEETHEITGWHFGDSLEFVVYDKGAIVSKTEGTAEITWEHFYPMSFSSYLPMSNCGNARLYVSISHVGNTRL